MKFFSYDSKFTQLMLKLCYACYLNLLWFVCSLPIVTIGASTTALYYVCFKIVRDEEHHVGRLFFRAFLAEGSHNVQLIVVVRLDEDVYLEYGVVQRELRSLLSGLPDLVRVPSGLCESHLAEVERTCLGKLGFGLARHRRSVNRRQLKSEHESLGVRAIAFKGQLGRCELRKVELDGL